MTFANLITQLLSALLTILTAVLTELALTKLHKWLDRKK